MPRIKIIAPPDGDAPQAMRHAWVGCVMRTIGVADEKTERLNIVTAEPVTEQCAAYIVEQKEALHALDEATESTEVMRYWEDRCHRLRGSNFLFNVSICDKIDP